MFCKHCGSDIVANSTFCPHCGKRLEKRKLNYWFDNLKRSSQILLLCYIAILIYSVGFRLTCSKYDVDLANGILYCLLTIIPFCTTCFLYVKKYIKPNFKKKSSKGEVKEISLLDFGKEHGQMRVRSVAHSSDGSIDQFCVFIKETKVVFSESLGKLSAREISLKKNELAITKTSNGEYTLIRSTK